MATLFKHEDDLESLFPNPLSIDADASHGAWLRCSDTGQEFIDFSGTWPGWGLGHGLPGYNWWDFLNDVESVSTRNLHLQVGEGPLFIGEVVEPAEGFHFFGSSAVSKLGNTGRSPAWQVFGTKGAGSPVWFGLDWLQDVLLEAENRDSPVYLDETKTFWTDIEPLLLASSPWSRAAGSLIFLDESRALKFETRAEEVKVRDSFNLAKFFDGKLIDRSQAEFAALQAYLERVFGQVVAGLEGLEVIGTRGLNIWCQASSEGLRSTIVRAAHSEGLLLGFNGDRMLSFHVPYQVKADVIGRAAAQFEAGLNRALEEMNRWLK
jgi:hypothetical protein